jgi:hypothetical protein
LLYHYIPPCPETTTTSIIISLDATKDNVKAKAAQLYPGIKNIEDNLFEQQKVLIVTAE